jgi:hypothetical protein
MINFTQNFKDKINIYLGKYNKIKEHFKAENKKYYKLVLTKEKIKLIEEAILFYTQDLIDKDDVKANDLTIINLNINKILGKNNV